jgi:hypothetical protein
MKSKRFVMASSIGAVLILAAVLTFFYRGKLFARNGAGQQAQKVDAPAKAGFIDVFPVTFHPVKGQEIALPDGEALSPRVSPDGARIVCVVKHGGKGSLAVAELPSGAISSLTVELDEVADPAWSADGSQIVFAGKHQEASEIYLYHLKSKKLTRVTRDPARKKSWPRCSPYRFGKEYRIAYTSEEKGRKDIWWVRESGEYDQPLTVSPERKAQFEKDPYWEKESAAGGAPPPITNGGEMPEWSPSGNLLLYRTGPSSVAALAYTYSDWWHPAKIRIPASSGMLSWAPNQCGFLEYDPMKQSAAVIARPSLKRQAVLAGKRFSSPPAFFPDGQGFAATVSAGGKSVLAIEPYSDPLGDVANLWMFPFADRDREKLARNQLIFQETGNDQIYTLYDSEAYGSGNDDEFSDHARPYFVTSDAVLETFYASFSALYANAERTVLSKLLTEFCSAGVATARSRKSPRDVETLFSVGLALLKPDTLKSASASVREEVRRIEEAAGKADSLFGINVSYDDFFIRGKYERDTDLKGLFRTLKWFQAFTFGMKKEDERAHAAAILAVARDPKVYPALEKMFSLYTRMLGESRYRSPLNLKEIGGSTLPEIKSELPWLKGVDTFRLLPPIYTLDAFIFDELIFHSERSDTVGTLDNPRTLPRGLDIMAVLGSPEARKILVEELKEGRYENYERHLDRVTALVKDFPRSTWDASIYQNWLDLMGSLAREPENAPPFTKTAAWRRKQLNTALGSWVNLRYETIAMVEQVASEAGEGGYEVLEVGRPRGYVEPNPEFFRTLDRAFERLAKEFENALGDAELRREIAGRFAEHRSHLRALEEIARKELKGKPLTDGEYEEIISIGRTVEHFMQVIASANGSDGKPLANPEPIRKIVDVQKDDGVRLYEALGHAGEMDVVVPYFGRRQIAKGSIYTYYEFVSQGNLNSENWRNMKQPRPVWISDYYGSATVAPMKTLDDTTGN